MAEKKENDELNLDEIARKIARSDEALGIDDLTYHLEHEILDMTRYTDEKGVVRYKPLTEDKDKLKAADMFMDTLAYHFFVRYLGKSVDEFEKNYKNVKDPQTGESMADVIIKNYFGVDRMSTREMFSSIEKLDLNHIKQFIEKASKNFDDHFVNNRLAYVKSKIGDTKYLNKFKGYLKSTAEKYKDLFKENIAKEVEKTSDPQQLLGIYQMLSKGVPYFRKEKKKY